MAARPRIARAAVAAAFLASAAAAFAAPARAASARAAEDPPVEAVVRRVIDGDTLDAAPASGGRILRVRLIGINSTEIDDARESVRFMAHEAGRFAALRLNGRRVRLEFDWERQDKYGRTLAYVRTEDGALFNETIVREGFAYAFTRYPFRKDYQERFLAAQAAARREGKGLWRKEPYPVVGPADALARAGQIVTVRFECRDVARGRGWTALRGDAGFAAIVGRRDAAGFARLDDWRGRTAEATGLVEADDSGRPRISLYVAWQLRASGKG